MVLLRQGVTVFAGLGAVASAAHHQDAVADAHHLRQLGRDDDDRHAVPGKQVKQFVDFRFGADIDATSRLVDDEHAHALLRQPAAKDDLLLVAAGQVDDVLFSRGRAHLELLDEGFGRRHFAGAVQHAEARVVAPRRDVDVFLDRAALDDAVMLAIFRAEHDAGADRIMRIAGTNDLAIDGDRAARARIGAEDQPHQFRAPGADQAEEADDLARPRLEAGRNPQLCPGEAIDLQADIARLARSKTPDVGDFAADHFGDDLVAGDAFQRCMMRGELAVAQHRQAVAKPEHLVQPMRYVDDDLALAAKAIDEREQDFAFTRRQRRGRLVQRDDASVEHDRLGDLDHLALADGQRLDLAADIDVDARRFQLRADVFQHCPARDDAGAGGKAPEAEIFGDRQFRNQLQFLVDDDDAIVEGIPGR